MSVLPLDQDPDVTRPEGPLPLEAFPGEFPIGQSGPTQAASVAPETQQAVEGDEIPEESPLATPLLDFSRSVEESFSDFSRDYRGAGVNFFADGVILEKELNQAIQDSNQIRAKVTNENARRKLATPIIIPPEPGPRFSFNMNPEDFISGKSGFTFRGPRIQRPEYLANRERRLKSVS